MCGRSHCALDPSGLQRACTFKGKDGAPVEPEWKRGSGQYKASYNVAPTQIAPVLTETAGVRQLQPMKWGLVPSFHKGDPRAFKFNMSNARIEGILGKASYKRPLERGQRCVVVAEGFYEWEDRGPKGKQPYYVYRPAPQGQPKAAANDATTTAATTTESPGTQRPQPHTDRPVLTMAGIFDVWSGKGKSPSAVKSEPSPPLSSPRRHTGQRKLANVAHKPTPMVKQVKQEQGQGQVKQEQGQGQQDVPSSPSVCSSVVKAEPGTDFDGVGKVDEHHNEDVDHNAPNEGPEGPDPNVEPDLDNGQPRWVQELTDDGTLLTFTIITVPAAKNLSWLHNRMPAILDTDEKIAKWLDTDSVSTVDALSMLQPCDSLTWHPVDRMVGSVRNNSVRCLDPVDPDAPTPKERAVAKQAAAFQSWLKGGTTKSQSKATVPAKVKKETTESPAPGSKRCRSGDDTETSSIKQHSQPSRTKAARVEASGRRATDVAMVDVDDGVVTVVDGASTRSCPRCTFANSASALSCSMCGGKIAPPSKSGQQPVACKACTLHNPATAAVCSACGHALPTK